MKNTLIVALIAVIGVGAAVVYANPRTVETEAAVEVRVWRNVADPSRIHLSTRPAEGRWTTHQNRLVFERSDSGNWDQSNFVAVTVPISVEVPDAPSETADAGLTPDDGVPGGVATETSGLSLTTGYLAAPLRTGPGSSYPEAGTLPGRSEVTVIGRDNSREWIQIAKGSGLWLGRHYFSVLDDFSSVPIVERTLFGEGQECLATTGCGIGFFEVPLEQVLRVGVDIAAGQWNSDYEGPGEDSCYIARLSQEVASHENYRDGDYWEGLWIRDLLLILQPSGLYARHASVIDYYATDYVRGPTRITVDVLPSDYAVIFDGDCE